MKKLVYAKVMGILALLLAACTTSNPFFDEPTSAAEMQNMQSHLNQVQMLTAAKAWTMQPSSNRQGILTWQFSPYKGLSLNIPAGNLDIQPATNGFITLKLFNDPLATLEGTANNDSLALTVKPNSGGKAILYLPPQTNYLSLHNLGQIHSLDVKPLYLHITNSANVSLQAHHWMLEYLYLDATTDTDLEGIATPYLLASIRSAHQVTLSGTMSLREVNLQNSDHITIYEISSPILTLNASGTGSVFLSGNATISNMMLKDNFVLDSRYMPSKRLFIKTFGTAQAQVRATDELNALAGEWSLIGYYNQPALLSRYYRQSGSILYLGEAVPVCTVPECPAMPHILPG